MRSESAAELLLSLVVPPDDAATMIGDLAEESSVRGKVWFWWSVMRTAAYRIGRELCDAPWQMANLAFAGLMLTVLLSGVSAIVYSRVVTAIIAHGGGIQTHVTGGLLVAPPAWLTGTLLVVLSTLVPLLVGWLLADRSRGREMAALVAYLLLMAALHGLELYLSARQIRRIGLPYPSETLLRYLGERCFLIMGGVLSRVRKSGREKYARY